MKSAVYILTGEKERYKKISAEVEAEAKQALKDNPSDLSPYRVLLDIYEN